MKERDNFCKRWGPEDMRGYVEVDVEQIARDWESDYYVADLDSGLVAVFEPGA